MEKPNIWCKWRKIPLVQHQTLRSSSQQSSSNQCHALNSFSLNGFSKYPAETAQTYTVIFRNICYECTRCTLYPITNILTSNMKAKMQTSSLGLGNSIFLSIRPGLRRAWSKISILLVAIKTYNWKFIFRTSTKNCELISKESNRVNNILYVQLFQVSIYNSGH